MKLRIIALSLILQINFGPSINAQTLPYKSDKSNFYKIVADFNTRWRNENHRRSEEYSDGEYAQFKRWEWFWQSRIKNNGEFPDSDILKEETEKFTSNNSTDFNSRVNPANWKFFGPVMDPGGDRGIGRLNCIAFHPTNINTYWVGSAGGGLWKTTDNGSTWSTNTDKLPVLGVSDIVIDPKNPNILYLATGDGEGADNNSVGVLKSTDGGLTWKTTSLIFSASDEVTLRKFWINPNDSRTLIVTSNNGLYRTTDSGNNWTKVQSGKFIDIEQNPGNTNTLYASTIDKLNAKCAIYTSNNAGQSWFVAETFSDVIRIELAVSKSDPTLVLVLTANSNRGFEGIYYSENSGNNFKTWITGSENFNLLEWSYNGVGKSGQGSYDLCLAINPNDIKNYYVGGVNTWVTNDDGDNWFLNSMWTGNENQNPNKIQVVHADKHAIVYHPLNPSIMFECNDGGLFYSNDKGTTWVNKSKGLQISQIYRVSVSQTKSNLVICGLQDNGTRANNVNFLWDEVTGGDGTNCIIDPKNENIQYSGYVQGTIYRTLDNWKNVDEISDNIPGKPSGAWVSPFALDPNKTNIIYAAFKDIYYSEDRGDHWSQLSSGLSPSNLLSLAIAPNNSKVIYAASEKSIYATYDGGQSWDNITNSTTPITDLIVNPTNSDVIYITVGGYTDKDKVWKIKNRGQDWVDYSANLPNVPVNCILFQKGTQEGLYVGTDIGVFYGDLTMPDWVPFNTNLPNVKIADLDYSYRDNKIYAASYGRGLWSSTPFSFPIATKDYQISYTTSISPNPSSGKFSIVTTNSIDKIKDIKIFNLNGQNVFNDTQEYFGLFYASIQLPNGTYSVHATVNEKQNISKLIIYN